MFKIKINNNFFILIIVFLMFVGFAYDRLMAQEQDTSLINTPKQIEGTIINQRPLNYDKGLKGGVLNLGDYAGDPKTFNITVASENTSLNVIRRFLISLMDYNEDYGYWYVYPGNHNKGEEGRGYDIEISPEGEQILSFYLRNDVYWTDGVRMTAEDWVWYWNNIYTDEYLSPIGYNQAQIVLDNGDVKMVKAKKIDKWTFQLIFPRVIGIPELIADISPMPKHILRPLINEEGAEAVLQLWSVENNVNNIVGNGPWILEKYLKNEMLIFQSNKKFFIKDKWGNPLPYLDKLRISLVPDKNTLYLKFKAGELDSFLIQNSDFKNIIEEAEKNNYSVWNGGLAPELEFLSFNQNPESERLKDTPKINWFTQKEFRQAMTHLIDKDTLVTQVHNSLAEPSYSYIPKDSAYYNPDVIIERTYNPSKALKLLEEINIRDRNGDGVLEDEDKNKIKFEVVTNSGNRDREKSIELITSSWRTFGLDAYSATLDFNVLVTKLVSTYDWDCVVISLETGLIPLNENLYLSSGNLHLWHPLQVQANTEWEKNVNILHRTATYEKDFETRKFIIEEMMSVLYEQLPMIPLTRKYTFRAVYNEWSNVNWDVWTEIGGKNNMRVYKK